MLIPLAKEFAEIPRRAVLRALNKPNDPKVNKLVNNIKKFGYVQINNYWNSENCRQAISAIDKLCLKDRIPFSWVDEKKSDFRFFRAENHDPIFESFYSDDFIEKVRRGFTGRSQADKLVLAAKLIYKDGNEGSGGGWHMDSPFALQFKAFLFLTNVSNENGPLEVMTQTKDNLLRMKLEFRGIKNLGQYRFTNNEAEKIQSLTGKPIAFTVPAGTLILANVSSLHRGRPILSGTRYALTLYCGDPKIKEKTA